MTRYSKFYKAEKKLVKLLSKELSDMVPSFVSDILTGSLLDEVVEDYFKEGDFDDYVLDKIKSLESSDYLYGDLEKLIADGKFDDAVYERFTNSNKLIDRYCGDCDQKCKDTCDGRRYRG